VGAAVTGLTDWSETDGRPKRLGLVHGLLNLSATSLYVTSLAMRRNGERHLGRVYGLAGFAVACAAAYLGGALVYRERIGVTHADEDGPSEFTRALPASDLPDNARRLGNADGTPVMVARQHGTLCALAEHCSHLGGPLSEGELKDGSIVCPWHGSEFALRDGRVINGPATHPQPCFDVRERDGAVEVRVRQ
jgi:nitrite reductase/ring-hydroxylating ferredoxin subunit